MQLGVDTLSGSRNQSYSSFDSRDTAASVHFGVICGRGASSCDAEVGELMSSEPVRGDGTSGPLSSSCKCSSVSSCDAAVGTSGELGDENCLVRSISASGKGDRLSAVTAGTFGEVAAEGDNK